MRLFEIDSAILECVDVETGEIFDEDKFEELSMEREAKIENLCVWIKELKAEAEAIKAEEDALSKRRKAKENKAESLKRFLAGYLDGTPFESARAKVGFKASEAIEIDEDAHIPSFFLREKTSYEPDKKALKEALKKGEHIEGVSLIQKQNIQIN